MSQPARLRAWSKRAFLVAFGVLLPLLALEAVLRWQGYDRNPHPFWRYDSSLGWRIDPQAASMDGVNADGFRFPARPRTKPPGTKRVLVLGDSFVLGASLPYRQTLPAVLEERLSRGGETWESISLAVDDWGTAQQAKALYDIGLDYQPDAVVIQTFPFNDFCNNTPELAFTCSLQDGDRPYFGPVSERDRPFRAWPEISIRPISRWLRRRSYLWSWAENRLRPDADPARAQSGDEAHGTRRSFFEENARRNGLEFEGAVYALLPPERLPPSVSRGRRATADLFARIHRDLADSGITLLVLVVPFSATYDPLWDKLVDAFPAPIRRTAAGDAMEGLLRALGIAVISGRDRISAEGEAPQRYFISPDDGHFSAHGHARAAHWIAQALAETGTAR